MRRSGYPSAAADLDGAGRLKIGGFIVFRRSFTDPPVLSCCIGNNAYYVNTKMIKSTGIRGSRGRPSKHPQDRPFQMRVSEDFLRTVDDWRRRQKDLPSRAEAIRRMVELASKLKGPSERDS